MRPRLVLMTGAPGSGKSTLGTELARLLRVPFLARDDIRGGLFFSAGAWSDELARVPPADEAVEVFLQTVEGLLARGVSCVVEYVVRSHRPADLDRLLLAADCIVIMTTCDDASARVARRNRSDRFAANPAVLRAVGFETVEEHTEAVVARMQRIEQEMLLEFPVPTLLVDTSDGYEPSIDAIVEFATADRVRRRPVRANTELVRSTLDRLAAAGETWAPEFLGIEGGDECLSWLPGLVRDDWRDHPARLDQLARIVRRLHDRTVDAWPGAECLVHDDLQPRNVVIDDDGRLGLIDWEQLRPGRRLDDVAQLCWSFLPPLSDGVRDVARRWRRVLDAYGPVDRVGIVPASIAKLGRCIDDTVRHAADGSARHAGFLARGDHVELATVRTWLIDNEDALTTELVAATSGR